MAANRTVSVALIAKVQGFTAGVATATKSAKDFRSELDDLGKKSPGKFNDIAQAAAGVGISLVGMAGYAVKAAAEFDKQMSEVGAVSNATGKELDSLRAAALKAGKDTQFSATEAAQAEAELAKAGLTSSQILGGALDGALSLAAAGQMNLADAATIAAQTLNEFELRGSATSHVADVLASAANTSAADMHGLGLGLQQVGLVAHQVGFSLEETVGLLSAFADRGLAGSDGATSLKVAIQRLIAPTEQAKKLMQQLGIEVYDSNGHMNTAAGIAGSLQKALSGLGESQRNAALYTLFGSDAIRAANILYTLGADGVEKYTEQVNQSGAAAAVARAKTNNLAGDIERLKGSIETLAIQSGSGANSGLRVLVQIADHMVGSFAALPGPVQSTVTVVAGLGGGALLAAAGLMKVRQAGLDALAALRDMGPMGGRAAGALSAIGKWGGIASLAAVATFGLREGLQALDDKLNKDNKPRHQNIDQLTNDLERFAQTGKVAGDMAKAFGPDLGKLSQDIAKVEQTNAKLAALGHYKVGRTAVGGRVDPLSVADRKAFEQGKADIADLNKSLVDLVNNGSATQAKIAFDKITEALLNQGRTLPEINAMFGDYEKAASGAAVSNSNLAHGFGDVGSNALLMSKGLQDAIDHGETLLDVFKQLNGTALDWAHAQDDLNTAILDANDTIKKNGHTIDAHTGDLQTNTRAGIENRAALEAIADKTSAAMQARLQDSQSLDESIAIYKQGRDAFIAAAMAAGLTKQKAEELADQWLKMPPAVQTVISTPGMAQAMANIAGYRDALNKVPGSIETMLHVVANTASITGFSVTRHLVQRWGGAVEHAAVGALRDAAVYAAGPSPLYAFAEPQTKGEAFIPKAGDYRRSMGILDHAAGWYGAQVVPSDYRPGPAGGGRGGGAPAQVEITLSGGDRVGSTILGLLRTEVNSRGGNVQLVMTGRDLCAERIGKVASAVRSGIRN